MTYREMTEARPGSLHDSLIERSPLGVTVHEDLPGGWLAIVAKHPDKVPYVTYHKNPSPTLRAYSMAAAERWAA